MLKERILSDLTTAMKAKDAQRLFIDGNRPDLAETEQAELAIIESYLPEPVSEDEIIAIIDAKIELVGASGLQDLGKVMGPIMGHLKGKADGGLVNRLVKARLES